MFGKNLFAVLALGLALVAGHVSADSFQGRDQRGERGRQGQHHRGGGQRGPDDRNGRTFYASDFRIPYDATYIGWNNGDMVSGHEAAGDLVCRYLHYSRYTDYQVAYNGHGTNRMNPATGRPEYCGDCQWYFQSLTCE